MVFISLNVVFEGLFADGSHATYVREDESCDSDAVPAHDDREHSRSRSRFHHRCTEKE
jgi:hypothetical protein